MNGCWCQQRAGGHHQAHRQGHSRAFHHRRDPAVRQPPKLPSQPYVRPPSHGGSLPYEGRRNVSSNSRQQLPDGVLHRADPIEPANARSLGDTVWQDGEQCHPEFTILWQKRPERYRLTPKSVEHQAQPRGGSCGQTSTPRSKFLVRQRKANQPLVAAPP